MAEENETGSFLLRAAHAGDVDALDRLINQTAAETNVLARSREHILEHLRDFVVAERGGRVLGCGALALFTGSLAEIKSLVVAPEARGLGVGSMLVEYLLQEARRLHLTRVFALTDHPPFFLRQGFELVEKPTLPQKVWRECVHCPKYLNCAEEAVAITLLRAPRAERA